jgi:hypothetical protein
MKERRLEQILQPQRVGMIALLLSLMLLGLNAKATVVSTIAGGPLNGGSATGAGDVDDISDYNSLFNKPMGMAFDSTGNLYIADYNNNSIRFLDISGDYTLTFATNGNSHPVGVAIDQSDNIYILNYGNGANGSVLQYDTDGYLQATNATSLQFVGGIVADFSGNVYVTSSNQVIQIATAAQPYFVTTNQVVITNGVLLTTNIVYATNATRVAATVPIQGSLLKGITYMTGGILAVADYGRNGIYNVNPYSGGVTINTGFNGQGDAFGPAKYAKFFQPYGLLSVGNDCLIVADYGNNRVKYVDSNGAVTNVYGVDSYSWSPNPFVPGLPAYPGLVPPANDPITVLYSFGFDNYNTSNNVEARLPIGLAMSSDGSLYASEGYYNVIRKVTAANLPLPPQPPAKVAAPQIGIVTFIIDPVLGAISVFNPIGNGGTTNLFNPAIIAIEGANGAETYYDSTNSILGGILPNPTTGSPSVPYFYVDGTPESKILSDPLYNGSMVAAAPNLTIKAISAAPGAPSSDVVSAQVHFITQNPFINGNNAAQFSISDGTTGAAIWYTFDGSEPSPTNLAESFQVGVNGTVSLQMVGSNLLVKAKAITPGFADSVTVSNLFSSTSFVPNTISFGFASGEASSDFVGSPGQYFSAPITLSVLNGQKIYSMIFNVTVTNGTAGSPPVVPGAYGFSSFLEKPALSPPNPPNTYVKIPPYMYIDSGPQPYNNAIFLDGSWYQNLVVADTNGGVNLLGVGWIERYTSTNLYDTLSQTLITFSQAHDVLYGSANGLVEVGAYGFQIPTNAVFGNSYQIQIDRPSASSDGIGTPGSAVFLAAPTNGSLGGGAPINALKNVTVGQRKYVAGSVYPFRWFNAGDFGTTNISDSDLLQVYQSAIDNSTHNSALSGAQVWNTPPDRTDMYDALDSCGSFGVLDTDPADPNNGYYTNSYSYLNPSQINDLLSTDVTTLSLANQMAFGDGVLDVCDVYLSFLRSIDGNFVLFQRFWNNGQRVAQALPNIAPNSNIAIKRSGGQSKAQAVGGPAPLINFTAGDNYQVAAGQMVSVPITASVFGNYPARAVMINVTVNALDGSPALTAPLQFTQTAAVLGSPATFSQGALGNSYSLAWLNVTNSGITGSTVIGNLSFTIPTSATAQSAYAVHFNHASASPNGFISLPKSTYTGLITLSSRTNSSYGDGIPDSWRLRWFGTTNNSLSISNACASGDGFNNWQKYLAGVDPTLTNDFPHLNVKVPAPAGATGAIHWPTVSNKQYVIERSSSLYGGWFQVSTNTGTGGDVEFDDTTSGTGSGARFYRVRILQ